MVSARECGRGEPELHAPMPHGTFADWGLGEMGRFVRGWRLGVLDSGRGLCWGPKLRHGAPKKFGKSCHSFPKLSEPSFQTS